MRVLIIGAAGQLGTSLRHELRDHEVTAAGRNDLDVCSEVAVRDAIRALAPDAVINAAAMRRPDECELQPERAFAVNALGTRNIALACASTESVLLQVSTDNVFDGRKSEPYVEDDLPNPITTYGVSKLAGEFFVRNLLNRYYVVRTSALFGDGGSRTPHNFVLTMLRQAGDGQTCQVVTDQYVSPTYTVDLAKKLAWLLSTDAFGVYHVTNAGACSWYEFARAIFDRAGLKTELLPTTTDALNVKARRLRYAVLGNRALRQLGADDMPAWDDALDRYLSSIGMLKKESSCARTS